MTTSVDNLSAYYIVADADRQDQQTRVLKHADTFAVFDAHGDITSGGSQEQGLYHDGTRHLSNWQLRIAGRRPLLLSSTVGTASHVLTVDLTNTDIRGDGEELWPKGSLHIRRTVFLWEKVCYSRIDMANYGLAPMTFVLEFHLEADYRDVFEVRGTRRLRHGQHLPTRATGDGLVFAYQGLDEVTRQTVLQCSPTPTVEDGRWCRFEVAMLPGERCDVLTAVSCDGRRPGALTDVFDTALADATASNLQRRERFSPVRTSSDSFDEWLNRSRSDIAMMTTETTYGAYPYAGIPWFSTVFGRDGIITALATLWADPSLARGVLRALAATQATKDDSARDAQPGKILHEARGGEMAALGEVPFGRYYGSVDSTPLFIVLAGRYYDRTGDIGTIRALWPHVDAALTWMDRDGDADGDGFLEYARVSGDGLVQQGWKDSHDSVFHADGTLAGGPIALSEVQGYAYAARHHAAELAAALGDKPRARVLHREAERLHARFEREFWCRDLKTYALALDGRKARCEVVSSNAGQCLLSGIAMPERAREVAATMMAPDMFSGWGIRTVRAGEARYNPMSYHNGSVWPHDTALVALGFSRYGLKDAVVQLAEGLFDSSQEFELGRLPELFCGFPRRSGEAPTRYPTACAPQAWASAAGFLIVESLLGLEIDGLRRRVILRSPRLPQSLEWLRLNRLAVDDAEMDLFCERRGDDVSISVTRRAGQISLVTEK